MVLFTLSQLALCYLSPTPNTPPLSTPATAMAQVSGARRNQAAMCKLSIGSLKFYDFPSRIRVCVCVGVKIPVCVCVRACVIKKS